MKSRPSIITRHLAAVILLMVGTWGKPLQGEVFSTPENLKNNVAFWKKIYTEVSLTEGILHDSEYPLIIYTKITIGSRGGRSRRSFIGYHKNLVVQTLKAMKQKPSSQWTPKEQEIADLFTRYADMDELKTAWERVRFQLGQRERFKEGLERSGASMTFIRLMFILFDIPDRVAYLPHVESSFNIDAYSRAGAAGMWQFMHRTGRLFNLKIDYLIDERRDPIKSTIAAASLLKKNYNELKAWPLAITAYNHGPGSITRAVKETGSRDIGVIIEKYKNRRFRFASKNFYSCFLAASEIAANAEKYFADINYHPPLQYKEIQLESYLQPKTLEKHLGIPQEKIKELNPALRPIVFSRQLPIAPGYQLRIPVSMSPQLAKEKLAAIPASEIKPVPKILPFPSAAPAVKPAAPGTTPKVTINNAAQEKPKGSTPDEGFDATFYHLEIELLHGNFYAIITASADESLGHYAEWLDTPVSKIRGLNRWIRSIRLNQKIKIPLKNQLSSLEQFKTQRLEYHMALEEDFYTHYQVVDTKYRVVKYGDTLWGICNRDEEIPLWLLMKYNPGIDLQALKSKTRLTIPVIAPKNNQNK
jgi:hypothetical protein